jgi:hypothetical protein
MHARLGIRGLNAMPPATLSFTDFSGLYSHPSVVREHREVSRLLAGILVQRGRSADQARREAEALLPHMPPAREPSERALFRRAAG